MENALVKEMPPQVKECNAAIAESEFDLDIRIFTPMATKDGKEPQAVFTVWSCSCVTCQQASCWTCSCTCTCGICTLLC